MEKVSDLATTTKIPILKITINKKYDGPSEISSKQQKSKTASSGINNADMVNKTHINNVNIEAKSGATNQLQNMILSPKPDICNLLPVVSEKPAKRRNTGVEVKNDIFIPKTAYTRKGDLSRDNVRNQTSAERLRYLYTKAQRDCDILRIRLKALRERQIQEEEEIKKLQVHLGTVCKDIAEESLNETSEVNPKRKRVSIVFEDKVEKDEYEKLLKEVRKIKHDLLNQKYPSAEVSSGSDETTNALHNNTGRRRRVSAKLLGNNHMLEVTAAEHEEVTTTEYEEVTTEEHVEVVYDNCDTVDKKVNQQLNINLKSGGSMCFEDVYFDPVF